MTAGFPRPVIEIEDVITDTAVCRFKRDSSSSERTSYANV